MRVLVTGGSGFVGSNVVKLFAERHGASVTAPAHADLDLVDGAAVHEAVATLRPDAIVHCAILNDFHRLYADRRAGWDAYVGATRHVVDAANAVGAKVVLASTDWVFDGTQSGADEATPPNPVNLYGVLKAASELVVTERAWDGAVARLAGVNGVHWGRPARPRAQSFRGAAPNTSRRRPVVLAPLARQDPGFGYFVASIVDALSTGRRFPVWVGPGVNMIATPSLASHCAELMWRIIDGDQRGIFHCCGGETVGRWRLAELTAEVFGLDASMLDSVPPEPEQLLPGAVPYDTSLDARATAAALDVELPTVREMLRQLRYELETGTLAPAGEAFLTGGTR